MDVFDPVLGNGCCTPGAKGITWHPIKTATNGQLALGMTRWIIENKAYNADYLGFTNYKAAVAGGFASYTGATFLVIDDESSANNGKLMTAADAGLTEPEADPAAKTKPTYYVVMDAEKNEAALNTDAERGLIDFEGEVNGIKVRSAFLYLKDSAFSNTMDEYAEICGVPRETIEDVAREFTSHGVKAATTGLGSTAAANGVSSMAAYTFLNALIGSNQMLGGMVARRIGAATTADGKRYKLSTIAGKPALTDAKNCQNIGRTKRIWKKTDEYKNRIAAGEADPKPLLPWFSHTGVSDNQALISALCKYPYQAKIVMSWMTNTLQATSGLLRDSVLERMKDTSIIPLHIACDVVIGEHAQYADYIVPDTNPFESFGVVTNEGFFKSKGNSVRWPAKTPETIEISGGRHASFEAFCCDVAKVCDMPGFGDNAVTDVDGKTWPINDACDFFLKAVANLAYDTTPVDDVAAEDMKLQALDNLPEAWKNAVSEEEWPKVVYVLNRGGRFASADPAKGDGYDGDLIKTKYAGLCAFYDPKTASLKDALTGENFDGLAHTAPIAFADGTPMARPADRPFAFINWKARTNGTHRTIAASWLRETTTENFVWMSPSDAAERGLKNGDVVEVVGPEGTLSGHVRVTEGIRPGVVGANYSFGQQGYAARAVTIDGMLMGPAPDYLEEEGILDGDEPGKQKTGFAGGRGRGFCMNELLPEETLAGGGGVTDPIGGGAAQFDLWVDVRKA